jgi:hypothetical protein
MSALMYAQGTALTEHLLSRATDERLAVGAIMRAHTSHATGRLVPFDTYERLPSQSGGPPRITSIHSPTKHPFPPLLRSTAKCYLGLVGYMRALSLFTHVVVRMGL